jgi:hypothetical protein
VGTRRAEHAIPLYPPKLVLNSLTSGGRPVGIVRLRTKSHGVCSFSFVRGHKSQVVLGIQFIANTNNPPVFISL